MNSAGQPLAEFLRISLLDFKGFYCKSNWNNIKDVILGIACSLSSFRKKELTKRFTRHFAILLISDPDTKKLESILSNIFTTFFSDFVKGVFSLVSPLTTATVKIYEKVKLNLLPTPGKSHYLFNFRDLLKFVQGILQAIPSIYNNASLVLRLFYHESMRTYFDRLVDDKDRNYLRELLKDVCMK